MFSCSGWFGTPELEGVPRITGDRLAFIAVVTYALVVFALRREPLGRPGLSEAGLWLVAVIAATSGIIFGAFLSGYRGSSIGILFNFVLFPAVFYSLLRRTRYSERGTARLCLLLTLFGAYLGTTAILERTSLTWLLVPPEIGDPQIAQHWGRARGPFLQAEFNGAVMVLLLPVVVFLRNIGTRVGQIIALLTVPLLCVGVYLTETRAAILSLGVVLVLGASFRHPARPFYRGLCLLVCAASVLLLVSGGIVIPRLDEITPLYDRVNLLLVTSGMIAEHPVVGVGFGNFDRYQQDFFFRPRAFGSLSAPAAAGFYAGGTHNTLLTPMAELGMVVGGLYLLLVGWSIASAFVKMRTAARRMPPGYEAGLAMCGLLVGVGFVINAFFVELRFTPTPSALLWIFMGLVQGAGIRSTQAGVGLPGANRSDLQRATQSQPLPT